MTSTIALYAQPLNAKQSESVQSQDAIQINQSEWQGFEKSLSKVEGGSISMNELLALLAEIVAASHSLRSQLMKNNISAAVATSHLAVKIADIKCRDAQEKFAISLAASVTTMALVTAASVKGGQAKILKDKHLMQDTSLGKTSVSALTTKERSRMSANLTHQHTDKYQSVGSLSQMANSMAGNMNEIQHAADIRHQEENKATKDLKEKFDSQLKEYIQALTQEALKLNEIIDAIAKANLATNR